MKCGEGASERRRGLLTEAWSAGSPPQRCPLLQLLGWHGS